MPTKTQTLLNNASYSALFEYASEIVRNFIDNEEAINAGHLELIFGDDSWMSNFFNCNLHQLQVETVRDAVAKSLTMPENYNTQLARVQSIYSTICMACGEEVIMKMLSSLHFSLCGEDSKLSDNDPVPVLLREHPILIVSALGNLYFGKKRVLWRTRTIPQNS